MSAREIDMAWLGGDLYDTLQVARFEGARMAPAGEESTAAVVLFDTFDGELAKSGHLLVATGGELLLLGGAGGSLRQEASDPGFVSEMPEGPVQKELEKRVSSLRRLVRIGDARLTYRRMRLLDEIDKTLARCELTTLEAEGDRIVSHLRMTALRGYAKAVDQAAGDIAALDGIARVAPASVARTLLPESAGYVSKPAVDLPPDATAFRAANEIIRAHMDVARRNEAGTIDDIDSEFLHDYRVALRKVRSVVTLFKGVYAPDTAADLKARFGAVMSRTGRLRDLDVYLLERDSCLDLVPAQLRPGLDLLFDDFAEDRAREHRTLAEYLSSKPYKREMRDLAAQFDKPKKRLERGPEADRGAHDLAQALIWKRYRKICTIAAGIDASTPDDEVHELRIHCKKLRYLMEFFSPFFPADDIDPLIKALKKLQDTLGTFNDCAVQQQALSGKLETLGKARRARKLEIAQSLGALLAVLDQRQREARGLVVESFAAFDAKGTRKGFEKLFDAGGRAA